MADAKRAGKPTVALVVPCYNEEDVLPVTAKALCGLLDDLVGAGQAGRGSAVWFVDDGSADRTWAVVERLSRRDPRIRGVRLAANRGQNIALLAGLTTAEGDVVLTLDADLQDDILVIPRMLDAWRDGADIVFGAGELLQCGEPLGQPIGIPVQTEHRLQGCQRDLAHPQGAFERILFDR